MYLKSEFKDINGKVIKEDDIVLNAKDDLRWVVEKSSKGLKLICLDDIEERELGEYLKSWEVVGNITDPIVVNLDEDVLFCD